MPDKINDELNSKEHSSFLESDSLPKPNSSNLQVEYADTTLLEEVQALMFSPEELRKYKNRERNRIIRARIQADPIKRAKERERRKADDKRYLEKLKADPERLKRRQTKTKAYELKRRAEKRALKMLLPKKTKNEPKAPIRMQSHSIQRAKYRP